ncbi:hypothetical protein E4T43_06440 [Aureobasidium subglaciale]|nr:hypothetical protein E4T43_06440 [Aureobasidium subglaciale]
MHCFKTLFAVAAVLLSAQALPAPSTKPDYDVLVIGGGPAGLSATSGLGRVRRRTIMFDSGVYRNNKTRHMHDVIGNDGTIPAVFRAKAREQILHYPTVEMYNTTIANITSLNNGTYFVAVDNAGRQFTGRRVILATGLTDVMPTTPGVAENFGKGIYWCPWCDGYEHRDQPFGILGPLSESIGAVLEVLTLNRNVVIFANGTDNAEEAAKLDQNRPEWKQTLSTLGVQIDNRTITSITRLQDGSNVQDESHTAEYDMFEVNFVDGSAVKRSAFITNFPTRQTSDLGVQMGVTLDGVAMAVDSAKRTNVPGVFAVGDANNDGSTNVPHAMWSGKKSAVFLHVELSKEDVALSIAPRSLAVSTREAEVEMGDNLEQLYQSLARGK